MAVATARRTNDDREGDRDRTLPAAHATVRGELGRIGVMAARQVRSAPGAADVNVHVFSAFGVLKAGVRASLLARWDRMDTPIPDRDKIAYLRLAPTSAGHIFLVGLDLSLDARVHLVPNLEVVTYDDASLASDVLLRTTFSVNLLSWSHR